MSKPIILERPIIEKSEEQKAREAVPHRSDLPTLYQPCKQLLMVIPLPCIKNVGSIILPDRATITLNEGHIVQKGPLCSDQFTEGECVTWDAQSEYRMEIEGVKFILVAEPNIIMKIPAIKIPQEKQEQIEFVECHICQAKNFKTSDYCVACGAMMN